MDIIIIENQMNSLHNSHNITPTVTYQFPINCITNAVTRSRQDLLSTIILQRSNIVVLFIYLFSLWYTLFIYWPLFHNRLL